MKASDGQVLHSKSDEYSYEGFEERPAPGTRLMGAAERLRWSKRMTKQLRYETEHPHMKDLPSLMCDILGRNDRPRTIEETREILGGNHHFRVRSVKGEGDKVEHTVIVTEGPEQQECPLCAEEGRWHGAADSRKSDRREHRGGHSSKAAAVDYNKL